MSRVYSWTIILCFEFSCQICSRKQRIFWSRLWNLFSPESSESFSAVPNPGNFLLCCTLFWLSQVCADWWLGIVARTMESYLLFNLILLAQFSWHIPLFRLCQWLPDNSFQDSSFYRRLSSDLWIRVVSLLSRSCSLISLCLLSTEV